MSELETLLELIKKHGTVRQLNAFIRSRGLSGAGTWETLIDERVRPALRGSAPKLTVSDLAVFLRDAEEYGSQHVFLYKLGAAEHPVPDNRRLRRWLDSVDSAHVLSNPSIVNLPAKPTIVEARRDPSTRGDVLVVKVVERRVYETYLGTKEKGGGRFVREYQRDEVRAINVLRVHPDGLVELRIYRHKSGSRDYKAELSQLWSMISGLLDPTSVGEIPLVRAKQNLYGGRRRLQSIVSFSGTLLRSNSGVNVTAACGRDLSLFDDPDTEAGFATMTANGNSYYDSLNLWFLKQASDRPSEDIHVLLSGQTNEFAVTKHCSRADYEHVLAEIRRFNT